MQIKDNSGVAHDVNVEIYSGVAIVAYTLPMFTPISSRIIMGTGEIRAKMVDPDFRGSKDLDNLIFKGLQYGLSQKLIPASSGTIFGFVHPEHGSNKYMLNYGAQVEIAEINGERVNKWSSSIEDILTNERV